MKRIIELISEIRNRYPEDDFFTDFESSCQISQTKKTHYRLYNTALMTLDVASWNILKTKSLQHYVDHRKGQRKQGFFNQLNEAFAYRYLFGSGVSGVRLIQEGKASMPDIGYTCNGVQMYCEVKSLGISNDEIVRRRGGVVYNGAVHAKLDNGFINKFCDAVKQARRQIGSLGSDGLVYLIVSLDDITLDYYRTYRKQLIDTCRKNGFDNLFIKIGLFGNKRIRITQRSARLVVIT